MKWSDRQLRAWHLGVLDPWRAAALERAMDDRFFLALLRACPEPVAAAALRPATVRRLLERFHVRVLTAPQVMQGLRAPVLTSPRHVVEAFRDEAQDLARQIELLNEQILKMDERLEGLLESNVAFLAALAEGEFVLRNEGT